jgi:hypothetical protein
VKPLAEFALYALIVSRDEKENYHVRSH